MRILVVALLIAGAVVAGFSRPALAGCWWNQYGGYCNDGQGGSCWWNQYGGYCN